MPEMTLSEAAKWAGKSRPTIYKAIASGRLSARKDDLTNEYRIDPAELERVYSAAPSTGNVSVNDEIYTQGIALETAVKGQEIAGLKAEIALLKDALEDARKQRDNAMELANRTTKLLTDQSARPAVMRRPSLLEGFRQMLTGAK